MQRFSQWPWLALQAATRLSESVLVESETELSSAPEPAKLGHVAKPASLWSDAKTIMTPQPAATSPTSPHTSPDFIMTQVRITASQVIVLLVSEHSDGEQGHCLVHMMRCLLSGHGAVAAVSVSGYAVDKFDLCLDRCPHLRKAMYRQDW